MNEKNILNYTSSNKCIYQIMKSLLIIINKYKKINLTSNYESEWINIK
jgi:hypothetical protein